ncbi:MAG: hypothetical protein IPG47_05580 [Thermoflexaceae bacterium]|nr:hypothetical protein [Thermoflexaceae bacterium]
MVHPGTRPRRPLAPVAFRPPRALGVITGGFLAAWAAAVGALALTIALGSAAEFKTFVAWVAVVALLGIAVLFTSWTYCLATLTYVVERDTLTIRWGMRRVVIPIDTILRMVPGRTLDEAKVSGINWWGCHVGSADVKRIGYTLFYSTHSSPDELLYVHTTQESYALTVVDQAAFAEEVQARAAMGAVMEHVQRSTASGVAAFPFWRDRVAIGATMAGALMTALLCGYVFARYPELPEVVRLNFPALGGVTRVGDKTELLRLAYLGAGVMALNTTLGVIVHARERAAGIWLLASTSMLQLVLIAAAVAAMERV